MKFTIRYQDAWTAKIKNPDWESMVRDDWLECLSDLDVYQIKRGLDNLKRSKFKTFPPNCLEFHELCLEDLDFPAMHECYVAAIKGEFGLHPIVGPAAKACDLYWLRRASEKDGMKRFSGYYSQMKEKFLSGDRLERSLEIEHKPSHISRHWSDIEVYKRINESRAANE